jgi:hypothetical protein
MYYHSQLTGEAMITITDMNGKTVVQDKKHKSQSDLEYKYDLSGQSKGVYFIQVKLGEEKVITVIELK